MGTNHSPEKRQRAGGREDPWRLVQAEARLGLLMTPMAQAERPWALGFLKYVFSGRPTCLGRTLSPWLRFCSQSSPWAWLICVQSR